MKLLIAGAVALAVRARTNELPKPPVFIAGACDDLDMQLSPINPDWILEGAPVARTGSHSRSTDDTAATAVWDCTAGTFNWYFGWEETVMILEGSVHVTCEDGTERLLRPGDIAFFAGGTWAKWHVDDYVRKVAFFRRPHRSRKLARRA